MKRGEVRWVVDSHTPSGRVRQFFRTKTDAETEAAEKRRTLRGGNPWASLTDRERATLAELHIAAAEAGVTLQEVWAQWRAGVRAQARSAPITVLEAVRQCCQEKQQAGRRSRYVESLEGYLERFARGRESVQLASVTQGDIRQAIASPSLASTATRLSRIGTLFAWAVRRKLINENPCDGIERVTPEAKPPRILAVDECERLLRWVDAERPRALAWFSLALLAGIRPQEADRLTWASVDLERGIVTVDAAASKVRTRRIVHLLPCAASWMRRAHQVGSEMPLPFVTRRRAVRAARDAMGWGQWPADLLRHTAASYWLAYRRDVGEVAHELGNSPGVLLRVYREIVRREDAILWVAMRAPA